MTADQTAPARKQALRHAAAARIDALPPGYLLQAGEAIAARLAALPEYRCADTVFAFAGTPREIDTRPLLRRILTDGKRLALPRCVAPGYIEARLVTDLERLAPGRYGIEEPPPDAPAADPARVDLTLVPCLACDRAGRRLGHGGGYYDRWLRGYTGAAVLLCPECMLLDAVPQERHDVRVSVVVTEESVYRTGGTGTCRHCK